MLFIKNKEFINNLESQLKECKEDLCNAKKSIDVSNDTLCKPESCEKFITQLTSETSPRIEHIDNTGSNSQKETNNDEYGSISKSLLHFF